jgi:hypothetical protein
MQKSNAHLKLTLGEQSSQSISTRWQSLLKSMGKGGKEKESHEFSTVHQ